MAHGRVRARNIRVCRSGRGGIRRRKRGDAEGDGVDCAVRPACDALPAGADRQARIPQGVRRPHHLIKVGEGRLHFQQSRHVTGACGGRKLFRNEQPAMKSREGTRKGLRFDSFWGLTGMSSTACVSR